MLQPRCHIGHKAVVTKTEHLRKGFDHGVEVMYSKFVPLGDHLWFVLNGSHNVGRHRGEAVKIYCRLLGDMLKKVIDKAWLYCDETGVLGIGCWSVCSGLLHRAGPAWDRR